MKGLNTFDVLGVPISIVNPIKTANQIEEWARDKTGRFVCVRDIPSLITIIEDEENRDLHSEAAMVLPDSSYLAAIGKWRGHPVEQTCGSDLLELVCQRSEQSQLRHYFYGGGPGVASELVVKLKERYPHLHVVGAYCPPFRELTSSEVKSVRSAIQEANPDVVWVGLSSPKQDIWMRKNYRHLPQTLIGIGAAFDFNSGRIKRAPKWMRALMLEWLHRLITNPKRLWNRYLVQGPKFVFLYLMRHGISKGL